MLRAVLTAHRTNIDTGARPGVQALQGRAMYARDELTAVVSDDPHEIHPLLADVFVNLEQMSTKAVEANGATEAMDEALQEALGCLRGLEKALDAYRAGRSAAETSIRDTEGAARAAVVNAEEYQRYI